FSFIFQNEYYYDLCHSPPELYIYSLRRIIFYRLSVALRKGAHKTPEYAKINPFQLVPVIDDNGFKLTESVAILRYLSKKFSGKIPDHWYPSNPQKQAKVDEYMEWQHLNTRLNCAMYFQHKLLIPVMTQSPPNEKKVAQFQKRMEESLNQFETIWLKDSNFIAGDTVTLADLLAVCELQAAYTILQWF
ncbi:Glutathione S-transferase theta-1, partial [Armadillidium vulgare]